MNRTSTKVSCIILAGGEGKRADGADKGLIQFKDKRLIEHVIERISPQVDDIIISANRNLDIYKQYSNTVVNDTSDTYRGPLAGIAACLNHCLHDRVLVVACDMPSLPDDLVEQFANTIQNNAICIATVHERHQLALLMKSDLKDSITSRLNKNQLKFLQWVESVAFNTVSFDNSTSAFLNLNTIRNS